MTITSNSARTLTRVFLAGAFAFAALQLSVHHARSEPSTAAPQPTEALATWDGGGLITRADLEQVVAQKLPHQRDLIAKSGGREALLESMIRYDLLAEEAARRGYAKRTEVETATERTAWERMLSSLAVDPKAIPEAEVESAFAARLREFSRAEMRRATQIRVGTEAEAKALAATLRGADRERFSSAAREKNTDPRTQNQGGELGYFDREGKTDNGHDTGVPKQLIEAAFKLRRAGEISEPIAHDGAYSIVMLTGELKAITKTRADVEGELREKLAAEKSQRETEALISQLREKYALEVHPELLDAIQLPPITPTDIPEGFAAAPPDPRAPPVILEPDGI